MSIMNSNTGSRMLVVLLLVLTLALTGCGSKQESTAQPQETVQSAAAETAAVQTEPAEEYRLRENLTTILVMGLDKFERDGEVKGYTNKLQSDFLLLLVLDEDNGECSLLHLNRDTMTEIRSLGIGGGVAGTFQGQLALAHTYGSGGSDSALNAVKAVEKLLDVQIDHYMTFTMDAVGILNDQLGGITVEVLDDFSEVDPTLVKGETVTLMGDQALTYVRTRMGLEDSSNLHRMERQRQYLNALFEKLLEANSTQEDFLADTLFDLASSFSTDCAVTELERLSDVLALCTLDPIQSLPGEAVVGEEFMEFYVDQDALKATVQALFYEKRNQE